LNHDNKKRIGSTSPQLLEILSLLRASQRGAALAPDTCSARTDARNSAARRNSPQHAAKQSNFSAAHAAARA
jgi:hypothetical protein